MSNWISRYELISYTNDIRYTGVYVMYAFLDRLNKKKQIVYIGRSDNLRRRMSSHPFRKLFSDQGIKTDFKLKISNNSELLEQSLIRRLNPILNFQYTNKFRSIFFIMEEINNIKERFNINNLVIDKKILC